MEFVGTLKFVLLQHMTKGKVYNHQCLEVIERDTCYNLLLGGEFYWITIGIAYVFVSQLHYELNTYDTISSDLTSTQISTIFSIQLVIEEKKYDIFYYIHDFSKDVRVILLHIS